MCNKKSGQDHDNYHGHEVEGPDRPADVPVKPFGKVLMEQPQSVTQLSDVLVKVEQRGEIRRTAQVKESSPEVGGCCSSRFCLRCSG